MNATARAVTLDDVARASGYSRATVSRVVNGSRKVDPTIRAAVEHALSACGYSANRAARSLAGGSSHTIGLVFMERFRELLQNPYWAEIVDATCRVLGDAGYQETFLVANSSGRARVEAYLEQRIVDGVILMSAPGDDALAATLVRRGFPVTVFGTSPDRRTISSVTVDEEQGARLAAKRFAELGRRHPVVISGTPDLQVSGRRERAFRKECRRLGVPIGATAVRCGSFTVAGGRDATAVLIERHGELDAVYACSDFMAIGALDALQSAGRRVPDDVAVIGVDGTPLGEMTRPRLTSLGADHDGIGCALAGSMLAAIAGGETEHLAFPAHLVVRDSG